MFLKKNTILYFLLISIIVCLPTENINSQTWKKLPGTNSYINFLRFSSYDKNKLFIGSDINETDMTTNNINFPFFGDGFQISTDGGATFSNAILSDNSIYDLIESPSNAQILLVSARRQDIGRVYLSMDGGNTWDDTTKRCESSSQIMEFSSAVENNKDMFYASNLNSNFGLRYSDNYFATCSESEKALTNARDLAVSKSNPKVMYLAGDNVSTSKVLCSTDGGETWEDRSIGIEKYRILSISVSPVNEAIVLIGADSITPTAKIIGKGIYYSEDYGKTWVNVGADGASVFDIQYHPENPKYWAAAGGFAGVFVSGKNGKSWQVSTDGLPSNSFIRKVAIPNEPPTEDGIFIYASVYGVGLYKSSRLTDISDEQNYLSNNIVKQIYPIPANDILNISLSNGIDYADYEIIDYLGNLIMKGNVQTFSSINIQNLPTSSYFIKFKAENNSQTIKFDVVK